MKFILNAAMVLLASQISFAAERALIRTSDDHIQSQFEVRSLPPVVLPSSLVSGAFNQRIDHAGSSMQTFQQRYWVNSEFAAPSLNAPVLFHICGEGNAEDGYFLNDNALAWAKALGAHVVYLEHRYYGKSLPYADLSNPHLQALTLENVLEDFASFQKSISAEKGWNGKWIAIGGSYSGTLAALYRQRHPELVAGALASSAPMIAGVGQPSDSSFGFPDLSSTNPSDERPWVYQACTTFGFWMATGADIGATLLYPSSSLCKRLFGNVALVDVNEYNRKYDAPFISSAVDAPSNILFTYGSRDVWTKIGLSQQTNANSKITVQVIQGAGHHYDLNPPSASDSAPVVKARGQFLELAKNWLGLSPSLENPISQ
jgi:pimeloyl-ACP methyl ester carboxylesterase